jgi:regulator of replication initiation timing
MKDKVNQYDLLEEMLNTVRQDIQGVKDNIVHQERENDRHFAALNGEGDRIKEILKESIPREVFDRTLDSMRVRISAVEAAQIKAEGRHQLIQYIPWILTVISLIFMWLMYKKP